MISKEQEDVGPGAREGGLRTGRVPEWGYQSLFRYHFLLSFIVAYHFHKIIFLLKRTGIFFGTGILVVWGGGHGTEHSLLSKYFTLKNSLLAYC